MKEYHLYKNDYAQLQLTVQQAAPYCEKNMEHCFRPHLHSFFQLIWFRSAGQHFVDYQAYEHPANAIFFIKKGQVHTFCRSAENKGYLFHCNEIFLAQTANNALHQVQYYLFNELGEPFVVLPETEIAHFEYLTGRLVGEIEKEAFNYKQQVAYYFQVLLLEVERLQRLKTPATAIDTYLQTAMLFKQKVEEYKNRFEPVAFFSQFLGVSDKTLTTICKKYFKTTPANFIHQRKVLEAKRLLSNQHQPIKEIAYDLGFEQPTYFTKYFKKYTGITPKDFQKSLSS